jgi:hypothetical protein
VVTERRDIWDVERAPWATFQDALWVDNSERREAGLRAVLAWPGAEPLLRVEARVELTILDDEQWAWDRDIDARQVAYHKANPGSDWDRRE